MMFDLYAVVIKFTVKVAHILIRSFSGVSYLLVACVCNDCHWKNQSRLLKLSLTIHLSDAYDAFSSSFFPFSSLLSPMTMSLTNQTMKVLGLGSPWVRAFLSIFELSVDRVSLLSSNQVTISVGSVL